MQWRASRDEGKPSSGLPARSAVGVGCTAAACLDRDIFFYLNHPQSHGVIERYNRTLENIMGKMLSDHKEATWYDIRSMAVEAINNAVQGSISDNQAAISPAELWFARRPVLQSVPTMIARMPAGTTQYARMISKTWEQVNEYVMESARLYRQSMRRKDTARNVTRCPIPIRR